MTDKLTKVLDLLVAEEREAAALALNEWFAEQHQSIVSQLTEEDKDEEEDLDESITITVDGDESVASDVEMVEAEEEFEVEDEVEVDADGDVEEFGAEEEFVEEEPLTDRVDDLEAQLEEIRAQFAELMGDEAEDEEVEVDVEDEEEEEVEEDVMPGVPGVKTPFSQQSGIDAEGYKDIHEAVELDTVKEPIEGDKEVGNGPKVKIDTHSPVPNVKPDDRVGGTPVVVKGPEYKGYAMQTPPPVKGNDIKGKVRNAKKDLKDVPADGDKSAILNKEKSTNDLSPISGQEELRGSDIKRKK